MPRKTKKQKIIATYRKKLQLLNNRQNLRTDSQNALLTPTAIPINRKIVIKKPSGLHTSVGEQEQYDTRLKASTLADLKKTLIIAVLVLAFEFLIFYANLKNVQQFLIFHF